MRRFREKKKLGRFTEKQSALATQNFLNKIKLRKSKSCKGIF